jgi:hypothetical protein
MQEAEYFNLRLEIQASGRLERGTWSRSLLLFKKVCGLSQLVCFAWETGFWCTCTICLAGVVEDGSEQKCHEERSLVQDSRTWVEVWNGLYGRSPDRSARVCNLCENGDIFKMRNTLFFHVSVPNIYGTSSSGYLIIFLKVISKVLFFNITEKFTDY